MRFVRKTAALYFRTPDNFFLKICVLCEKPLRSIFALRIIFFLKSAFCAKNRCALFSHSG
ncbi:Uncharacterized protein dnm_075130 [Desulfonema magnum]|uniref:Uncharacterized protein n=1 Tax=Desulfonema magnum TaxID=45655 RepID=A0A975BTN3_9BACT|nr:Uncharacterized protein dnm_075130 [Desulfonema magnum]